MNGLDCGAACLSMICRAHDIPATLADCRQRLTPGPKGVNAYSLSRGAHELGLRATAYSAKTREAVEELSLPAIVHLRGDHFVVLEGRGRREEVSIVDPAEGRRKLGWPEFLQRHSGIALTFEPSAAPAFSPPSRRRIVARLLQVPDVRRLAAQLLAATLLLHLLALATPLIAAALVDGASTSSPEELVNVTGAGAAGLALALIVVRYLRSQLLTVFGFRLGQLAARSSVREILALPSPFYDPRAIDDVTRRLLRRIRRAVAEQAVTMLIDGSWMLVSLLVLLVLEPRFFAIAVAAAVIHLLLRLGSRSRRAMQLRRELAGATEPASRALRLLNAASSDPVERASMASGRAAARVAIGTAGMLFVLWAGAHLTLRQQTSLGTVLASASLAAQFLWSLASVLTIVRKAGGIGPRLDALGTALEDQARTSSPEPPASDPTEGPGTTR